MDKSVAKSEKSVAKRNLQRICNGFHPLLYDRYKITVVANLLQTVTDLQRHISVANLVPKLQPNP